jgi:hypothetical protein
MQQKHLYTAAGNAHSNIFGIIPPALPFSLSGLETRRKKPDISLFLLFCQKQQQHPRSPCKDIAGIIPKNLF